jgi:hypothetical protein
MNQFATLLHFVRHMPIIAIYGYQYYNSGTLLKRMKIKDMKCPSCGNELRGNGLCSTCGEKGKVPGRDIEVEYKEFKVSEFLEIRKTHQAFRGEGAGESETAGVKGTPSSSHAPTHTTGEKIQGTGSKKLLAVFLFVIIFLLIIAGGSYLLRVLFQK